MWWFRVSSIISAIGAEPLVWGDVRPHERGWLQVMKAMEECTIKAAIDGDYGALLEAFDLNPLIPNGDRPAQGRRRDDQGRDLLSAGGRRSLSVTAAPQAAPDPEGAGELSWP